MEVVTVTSMIVEIWIPKGIEMNEFEVQREEERAAVERERRAFERKQLAFIAVVKQFYPQGNGQPLRNDLDEFNAAENEWNLPLIAKRQRI